MWPNPHFHGHLVTFTKEILNGKLHFSYSGFYLFDQILNVALSFGAFLRNCKDLYWEWNEKVNPLQIIVPFVHFMEIWENGRFSGSIERTNWPEMD